MKLGFLIINKRLFWVVPLIVIVLAGSLFFFETGVIPASITKDELKPDLLNMFAIRDKAVLENNIESVKNMFDTSINAGRWAYEHEVKRCNYLNNWTIIRGTKFISMETDVKIQRIREKGASIWVDFLHSGKFTYTYKDMSDKPTSFGIGTRRTMELVKKNDKWLIKREWYLDPFEDILEVPEELKNEIPQTAATSSTNAFIEDELTNILDVESAVTKTKKRYNREKAVEYANKYSGATFGSGNDYKYNKRYRDYTGIGGDCSNFTSQVLADAKEGGGLKMGGGWAYDYNFKGVGGGTQAWARAASLKDYLLYSGKAQLVKRGNVEQMNELVSEYPNGIYKQIKAGDLVSYEEKGKVVHFSVITDFDCKGLPLVNSHTTDRYKVPWDLGWAGKNIKYWLLHIRD